MRRLNIPDKPGTFPNIFPGDGDFPLKFSGLVFFRYWLIYFKLYRINYGIWLKSSFSPVSNILKAVLTLPGAGFFGDARGGGA